MAREKTIYEVLEAEHRTLLGALEKLRASTDESERSRLLAALQTDLLAHLEAESATFYEALRDHAETEDQIAENEEEHESLRALAQELNEGGPRDARFGEQLAILRETLEQHVREEEGELFAAARDVLGEAEAEELARRFGDEKLEPAG